MSAETVTKSSSAENNSPAGRRWNDVSNGRDDERVLQNPLFGGYRATEAYLPSKKIAIAVVVTFGSKAFDAQGNNSNSSDPIFRAIATRLALHDAPPKAMG